MHSKTNRMAINFNVITYYNERLTNSKFWIRINSSYTMYKNFKKHNPTT